MKIGIFTGRLLDPLHPRIGSYIDFFEKRGLDYEIIPPSKNSILSRINWLSLYFFDLYSIYCQRKNLALFDLIFIQDLKYLPLAKLAKKKKRKVIYETLDNNVILRGYQLLKRFPILKIFGKSIINFYIRKEKKFAFSCCDKIIVNSKALVKYFDGRADLIYYCSSFETMGIKNNVKLKPALLYLGDFSYEKGAKDIIELQQNLGIDLYVFGTIRDRSLSETVFKNNMIHHVDRISHEEMVLKIEDLFRKHFLIGTSFIKSIHISYATQEANKEIDYLAMGIPIIGNHRQPTEEKILSGCGVFIEDEPGLRQLISDEDFRYKLSVN
ncbi:MAG: hypothetical protein NTV31_10145 [Bacteroidia bacterium]|nr:hypothetical protein [Bacteroidia bacterium]